MTSTACPDLTDPVTLARLALSCLDLTSLGDDDDAARIDALIARAAAAPLPPAALCVWPRFVGQVRARVRPGVAVAAVANFPAGSTDIARVLDEVLTIVAAGGDEVDLVLPWRALREGRADEAAALVRAVRAACPGRGLKLILESGELGVGEVLEAACRIGLDAGVDWLKTSTGKVAVGATPQAADVMLAAIAAHPRGAAVGFKASGGVRTLADVAVYAQRVQAVLGVDALGPRRLRFGASGLLDAIEAVLGGDAAAVAPTAGY